MQSNRNGFGSNYGIGDEVVKALDVMGYKEPMPVQERVIVDVQKGKDLIVKSRTGSGKTAAFGIPIVDALSVVENLPQVLVLTPTRELAVQVCEELAEIGKYKMIRCLPIYGRQPIHLQLRQLKQRVHITVGTPGRVADLIKRKELKLEQIKYLVIDEADELLRRGFIEEVEGIINQLPTDRITLLFSATMPDKIEQICSVYMKDPDRIVIESDEAPLEQIKQCYMEVADDWKFMRMKEILVAKNPSSCMIFCNTRLKVDELAQKLRVGNMSCTALHGAMDQKERLSAIDEFKNGQVQYLVATDIAARGIHVDKLDLVFNYEVPNEAENYVHRIGRSGRAGHKGEAITLVGATESKKWSEVKNYIGYEVDLAGEDIKALNGTLTKVNPSKVKGNSFTPKKIVNKHKDIARIRINAGKKKKIRAGDILGAVSNLPGITKDDIGIIDISATCTYIEIHNNKVDIVVTELAKSKVKGKNVTVKKMI